MKVGVVGASGYAGVELLRLCAAHPEFDVVVAGAATAAGQPVGAHTPSLRAAYPELPLVQVDAEDPAVLDGLDMCFLALPHGESQRLVPNLTGRVGTVVDLAADFRLPVATYEAWYGGSHACPDVAARAVYGLPELDRSLLPGATLVAAAGCYPTAATLALAPLVRSGLLATTGIVVDAASGVSGAGRGAKPNLHFGTVDEDFVAYGLLRHRHTPEMERNVGAEILFTPHLAPMVRGILATCYARPASSGSGLTTEEVMDVLHAAYDAEPFVGVVDEPPSTKATAGSNLAMVTARVDERTGWVVVLSAIDNLGKGAAGQAIQCANAVLGLPETTGLPMAAVYP
ncbi:MAG: N-acetyl-gamma-glutamyl-phosphate reductase [Actinomycetota bacterium]|jgi:N-acetyl-gamma-glutamyl-phosphate reductase|nr:N-acetyl-gamma-glutamyl-phosphate reductase [Actinomycetota bacterium]